MRPRLALCVLLAGAFSASLAWAQSGPQVDLQLQNCSGLSVPAVRRILAAELGTPLARSAGPGVTTALVVCDDGDARLRVVDPLSRKVVTRKIDVWASAPNARARLVAIAISELVLASWSELQTNPDPRVEPAGPPPPPAARRAASHWVAEHSAPAGDEATSPETPSAPEPTKPRKPPPPQFRLMAVISERAFFSHPGALWGGGVRVGDEPLSHVSWSLDAILDRGAIDTPIGRYEVSSATLGAAVYLYERWSWFSARVGGGLRVGVARSVGSPGALTQGASGLAPWGWPLATLSLSAQPFDPLVVELAGETSYVVLPLSGDKSSVSNPSVSGAWCGAELGIGVTF